MTLAPELDQLAGIHAPRPCCCPGYHAGLYDELHDWHTAEIRRWRWRTVRNPWPGPERVAHPLADRHGQAVREICRGRNGSALLEFEDGYRTVAPWRAAL